MVSAKTAADDFCRLGQAALRLGRLSEAEQHLASALAKNPQHDVAFALAAELRLAQGRLQEAILAYAEAVSIRPDVLTYKERFAELARLSIAAEWSVTLAEAMLACLRTPEIDCTRLSQFWYSITAAEPRFKAACDLRALKNFAPQNAACFAKIDSLTALTSPLFIHGLKRLIVYDPVFEEFIAHLRRRLLFGLGEDSRELTGLAAAIALYAFHTGFIAEYSSDERMAIDRLRQDVERGAPELRDRTAIAILASYQPLCDLKTTPQINARFGRSGPLRDLVKEQITDVNELGALVKTIPLLTPIAGGVSSAVRQQYERFPYPRWESLAQQKLLRDWEAQHATQNTERALRGTHPRILVAGCGTGRETAMLATLFPDAEITAVDLSRTSLAYAQLKARQYGLRNVTFYQADILEFPILQTKFDYVCATGVLHHMADPATGWKNCAKLLKPGGLMRVGLYSETGRKAIAAAREVIARQGYCSDEHEMRRFRRDSPGLLPRDVLDELLGFTDYYQLDMYRDLLFHVQEHRFTIPEISALLAQIGLQFAGFYLSNDVLAAFASEFPGNPGGNVLSDWDVFERQHPETFRNMYIFWCRKL